jgi:hypothetical protein
MPSLPGERLLQDPHALRTHAVELQQIALAPLGERAK